MSKTRSDKPTVIKKYANRRLYDTGRSSYVTLDDLCIMVKEGREFVVYDAKSGEDLTRSVLLQIIVAVGFAVSALVVSVLLGKTGRRITGAAREAAQRGIEAGKEQLEQIRTKAARQVGDLGVGHHRGPLELERAELLVQLLLVQGHVHGRGLHL